jgi:hypothetical protein
VVFGDSGASNDCPRTSEARVYGQFARACPAVTGQ